MELSTSQYRELVILDGEDRTGPAAESAQRHVNAVRASMESVGKLSISPVVKVMDMATAPLRMIMQGASSAASALGQIGLAGLGIDAVTRAVEGLAGVFTGPLGLADMLNKAGIGFQTMLGSADAGNAFLEQMKQFAIATPFKTEDLVRESQFMLAMGTSADQIIPRLTNVGDAVAALGGNEENIHNVVRALTQMESLGKVNARDMMELAMNNVDAWGMLAKGMHTTVADVREQSQKGALEASAAVKIILDQMDQRFHGMMLANANRTMSGLLAQIEDTFNLRIIMRWGEGLQSGVLPALKSVNDWLNANKDTVTELGDRLYGVGESIGRVFASGMAIALGAIRPVYDVLSALFQGFTSDAGAFGVIGDLVERAFGRDAANTVRPFLQSLMDIVRMIQGGQLGLALASIPGRAVRAFRDAGSRVLGYLRGGGAGEWFGWISRGAADMGAAVLREVRYMAFNVARELGVEGQLGAALDWLSGTGWPAVRQAAEDLWGWVQDTAIPTAEGLWNWLSPMLGGALDTLSGLWPGVQQAAAGFWDWVKTDVFQAASDLYTWLSPWLGSALNWLIQEGWPAVRDTAVSAWNTISGTVGPLIQSVWSWLGPTLQGALTWLINTGWPLVRGAAVDAWNAVSGAAGQYGPIIWDWLTTKIGQSLGWLIAIGWPRFKETATDAFTSVSGAAKGLPALLAQTSIPHNVQDTWDHLQHIGQNLAILYGSGGGPSVSFGDAIKFLMPQLQAVVPLLDAMAFASDAIAKNVDDITTALVNLKKWWDANGAGVAAIFTAPGTGGGYGYGGASNYPTSRTLPGGAAGGLDTTPGSTIAPQPPGGYGYGGAPTPHGAAGAVVFSRTRMVVGEDAPARPEVVAPLDVLASMIGGGGGGDRTINLHFPQGLISLSAAAADDAETLARRLAGPLARIIADELDGANALSGGLVGG